MKNEDSAVAQTEAKLATLKKTPRLENWAITLSEREIHFADDEPVAMRVRGKIYGSPHPRFTDGEVIQSSELIALDVGAKKAGTIQNVFELGKVDPAFLKYIQGLGKQLSDYNLNEKGLRARPRPGL